MSQTLNQIRAYAQCRAALTQRLKEALIDRLSLDRTIEEISDDCLLFGIGLGLDSVDALEIVVAIESEFCVRVEDADMREIRSINSIVDFILAHQEVPQEALQ
ncbi:acyl carrier protein [Verminephrobacter aporrectodeae subsp. tuberculatae]|uniref:acyl carrier protein n=1 Tax=Verminephrobacter aporrectodeae TaxID=1110389 RepID=UPI000237826B|nr:acyl carrier protein [Verminephrobacter aporrectodeae]MCW8166672.1 acyl carrier protein [Verminephrobacter aporrectodeae subsp. tuberculatae]MCW8170898.1 acyl carrier protein [Verminephrobacter aporrectodeae subsp. tuberculatae]MCW8208670.1 acyl carrier protein [Verminephrobacter aporrectodeae subsp. tuberculatae]